MVPLFFLFCMYLFWVCIHSRRVGYLEELLLSFHPVGIQN